MGTRRLALFAVLLMLASSVVIVLSDTSDAAEGVHPAYETLSDKQKKAYDSLLSGVASYKTKIAVSSLTLSQAEEVRDVFCSDHPEFTGSSIPIRFTTTRPPG